MAVDIALEGHLVEGEGKMIPRSGLQGVVLAVVIRQAVVESHLLFALQKSGGVRLQDVPMDSGRAVSPVPKDDGSTFIVCSCTVAKTKDSVLLPLSRSSS